MLFPAAFPMLEKHVIHWTTDANCEALDLSYSALEDNDVRKSSTAVQMISDTTDSSAKAIILFNHLQLNVVKLPLLKDPETLVTLADDILKICNDPLIVYDTKILKAFCIPRTQTPTTVYSTTVCYHYDLSESIRIYKEIYFADRKLFVDRYTRKSFELIAIVATAMDHSFLEEIVKIPWGLRKSDRALTLLAHDGDSRMLDIILRVDFDPFDVATALINDLDNPDSDHKPAVIFMDWIWKRIQPYLEVYKKFHRGDAIVNRFCTLKFMDMDVDDDAWDLMDPDFRKKFRTVFG